MTSLFRQRLRPRNDDGAVLVLALAFLLLFALFIPALLGTTSTNLSVSSTVDAQRQQVYAAEAGLRTRVEALRNSRTSAVYGSACDSNALGPFNALSVRVRCSAQPSSGENALTRPEYALLGLPALDSATEGVADSPTNGNGGGGADVYVGGKVASNGVIKRVANSNSGHFYIAGTAEGHVCSGSNIDNPDTGAQDVCDDVSTVFADPGVTNSAYGRLGSFPAATNPPAECLANASKFLPGYYTSMPTTTCSASLPWWFSPGTYYFDFTGGGSHVLNLAGKKVVAGTPNPAKYDPTVAGGTLIMPGSCKTDGDLPPFDGTEWIFGADTVLSTGDGQVELCPDVSYTRQEISIRGYGAGGETSPGTTNLTSHPSVNTLSPAGGYTNPTNAYAIDGATATSVIPANASRTITLSAFSAPPANASIEKVQLRIKHQELSLASVSSLALSATYADGIPRQLPTGCAQGQLCASVTPREDSFDITQDYLAAASSTNPSVVVAFRVSAGGVASGESLDGVVLDVTYAPPGDFRRQSGCALKPITATGQCDTLTNAVNGKLYVQGTFYAPLGRIYVTTDDNDPVQFNRGVIARDITGAIHPGNGVANPFGIGRPQRLALLTADVLENGVWTPRLSSLVRFDDNIRTADSRGNVTYLSWRAMR